MSGTRPVRSKLYYRKIPATWWLTKRSYFLFMLRELSSLFIALFLAVYLVEIYQLTKDPTLTSHLRKNSVRRDGFFSTWWFSYSPFTIASHGFNLQPWYYPYGWETI